MNGWSALARFLQADPRDVGCEHAMEMLHVYGELMAAGAPAERRYPGIAAHLRACGTCGEDFEGLLAALRQEAPRPSSTVSEPGAALPSAMRSRQPALMAARCLNGAILA
jgi:hypothetical protein